MNESILKKGVQIGVLGAALATSAVMGTGCAQPTDGTTIEKEDTTGVKGKNYATPTDVKIGNYFTIHKFVGEYDSIGRGTAVEDTNHYLGQAETYIKGLTNGFSQPEKFQSLINSLQNTNNYNVNGTDGAQKMDAVINAFAPCEAILVDVISNLGGYYGDVDKNFNERNAFECCYSVLANEAYYQAYGSSRNAVKDNYEYKKNQFIATWSDNEFLYPATNVANAYEQNNFTQITYLTDSLLKKAANKMGVSSADLRQVVNIALVGESLHAMHDLTKNLLGHNQETMMYNPTLKMQRQESALKREERNQYQTTSLER